MPFLQKHGLVTNDENYNLTSTATAPGEAAQLLLCILKYKGDGTLQKFLCSLNSETQHLGHKDIATKLSDLINRYHHQGLQMQFCPLCTTHVRSYMHININVRTYVVLYNVYYLYVYTKHMHM